MVGDSQLTWSRSGTTTGFLDGALKVVVLHPNLVVGFAGVSEVAMDWIADLQVRPDVPYLMEELLSSARAATLGGHLELLVAEWRPPRVLRIRSGVVEDRGDLWGWIGDQAAFDAFQREFASARATTQTPAREPASAVDGNAMVRALQSIAESAHHPAVGGLAVACVPFGDGLGYSRVAGVSSGGGQSVPSGEWTTLQFGQGALAGSCSEVVLTPPPGLGVIGVHVREIRRGVLLWPSRHRHPIDYFDCDQLEFAARVRDDHGVAISGPLIG
jgi:hypothetical protein